MMKNRNVQPTQKILDAYLTVFTQALYESSALEAFRLFEATGVQPRSQSYHSLIQMYVRKKNLEKALEYKDNMFKNNMIPTAASYGLLIDTTYRRQMLLESLQLVEEATTYGLKVEEKHIRQLRGRCKSLGIVHPDIPDDPLEWLKRLKKLRRLLKNSPRYKVQSIAGMARR